MYLIRTQVQAEAWSVIYTQATTSCTIALAMLLKDLEACGSILAKIPARIEQHIILSLEFCTIIVIYDDIWRALFLNVISTIKIKWACNDNAKFMNCVLEKSFSKAFQICSYRCLYMCIFMKSTFPKHDLGTWHWHCNLDLWIGTHHVLEKSIYICVCAYICMTIFGQASSYTFIDGSLRCLQE